MAKRFGRNQRRRMREEIAAKNEMLNVALARSAERAREASVLRQRLNSWAEEILHLMGEDSAFNEQLRRIRTNDHFDRLMLSPVRNLGPVRMDAPPQWEKVSDVITACILRCRLRSDDLRGQIAVEIGDHMGPMVGYAVPIDRRKDWSPRDIRYVAELVANKMAEHIAREHRAA